MEKKAGQKQEEAEEEGCEHTLQTRELVIDNTKSNKCPLKGVGSFLVKILHKKLYCELRVASEGKKCVAAETDQSVISTTPFHIEIIFLI